MVSADTSCPPWVNSGWPTGAPRLSTVPKACTSSRARSSRIRSATSSMSWYFTVAAPKRYTVCLARSYRMLSRAPYFTSLSKPCARAVMPMVTDNIVRKIAGAAAVARLGSGIHSRHRAMRSGMEADMQGSQDISGQACAPAAPKVAVHHAVAPGTGRISSVGRWLVVVLLLACSTHAMPQKSASNANRVGTIVLDAGHGGKDPGNLGTKRYKTTEKHVALEVTLLVGKYIQENLPDVKVVYTREDDRFIELMERSNIANRNNADVFLSIHCNANARSDPH